MSIFKTLRRANNARAAEWDSEDQASHSFYANELAGEMGEAIGALYIDQYDELAVGEELADTVICLDLLARRFDIDLDLEPMAERAMPGDYQTGYELVAEVGLACNIVKKIDREAMGLVGSRASADDLAPHLQAATSLCFDLAYGHDIDLMQAIARKFNKTSNKCGLTVMMEV